MLQQFYNSNSPARRAGFTLIEVVITVSIVAMIASISILHLRNTPPEDAVQQAIDSYHSIVELGRTYARTGEQCCGTSTPVYGYGVVFQLTSGGDNTLYTLYADLNNDHVFSTGDKVQNANSLPGRVKFENCSDDAQTVSVTGTCDILLSSDPKNTAYFNGSPLQGNYHTVIQSTQDTLITQELVLYETSHLLE